MFPQEQKIQKLVKTGVFTLIMMLIGTLFEAETAILLVLCLIYTKMRE